MKPKFSSTCKGITPCLQNVTLWLHKVHSLLDCIQIPVPNTLDATSLEPFVASCRHRAICLCHALTKSFSLE